MALLVSSLVALPLSVAHAQQGRSSQEERSRGTWAALLVGYVAVGALTTGAAYALRDSFVGRGIAVSAAGWGGFGLGAGAGYGLAQLHGCDSADCSDTEGVATAVGGLLGGALGSLAGHIATRQSGMSRPGTTAVGFAPMLLFLTVGTVIDW